jgi:peptide/nickel transport system ATP-binding protein
LNKEPLLEVKDLTVSFESDGQDIEITDRVSFCIYPGEIFGLVGESGCGKTVSALALLRLLPMPGGKIKCGQVFLKGQEILSLSPEKIREVRGKNISMIFQEPSAALNPLMSVKKQIMECFDYHEFDGDKDGGVREILQRVGFPDTKRILSAFPHELSGGMLQRVMIAMALILKPDLIIADEPTTALDVTIQAQIMDLLVEMKKEMDTSILLITHNLNLIAQYATRLSVMYAGRIVEESNTQDFIEGPLHPYTKGLLNALPKLTTEHSGLVPIPGQVPQPKDYVSGCRFQDRCPSAFEPCGNQPDLFVHSEHHRVACFLYDKEIP